MNHKGGTITFIKPGEDKPQFELSVGGALEVGVVDGAGRAFVNVEDKNEVVEIDTKERKVLHRFPIAGGEGPTGLAIDTKAHRLFIGCGGNSVLAVMDTTTGKIICSLPIGKNCDGTAFDPSTHTVFASCGDGTLTVVDESSDDKFSVVQTVATRFGAKTITIDPATHLLYLPTAEFTDPSLGRKSPIKPDSFQILVVGK